jgi:hypothetical protein
MEKDIKTLKSLETTNCKINNNQYNIFFEEFKCFDNLTNQLILNFDYSNYLTRTFGKKQDNVIPTEEDLTKMMSSCSCNLKFNQQRLQTILDMTTDTTDLNIKFKKLLRYFMTPRSLNIMKELRLMMDGDIKFLINLFDINNNSNISDDRRILVNKIFIYDDKKYLEGSFSDFNSSSWIKYPFTDVEEFRIDPIKFSKNLSIIQKDIIKNLFLEFLDKYIDIERFYALERDIKQNIQLNSLDKVIPNIIASKIHLLVLVYAFPKVDDIDKDIINLLSYQDIFFMIYRKWSIVLASQTMMRIKFRYDRCKSITYKLFKLLELNDVLEKNDPFINIYQIIGKQSFDVFFDNLIKTINKDIKLPQELEQNPDLRKRFEEMELSEDALNIAEDISTE